MNACSFRLSATARSGQTELPSGLRNALRRCLRRHLAHQIAIPRPFRNVQETLAVALLDPGLDGDDRALAGLAERAGHGAALDQQLEVLGRGMDQRALAAGGLV